MLLTTKLFRPKPPPTHLIRPRLLATLDSGHSSDLTLVAAPAGYGKTTVVSAWLAQHTTLPNCWVSLDERDNDPKQFWQYVVAALRQTDGDVGNSAEQALHQPQRVQIDNIVLSLINELWQHYQEHGQQWVLVLDDYHLIHTPAIHESLDLLIEQVPSEALRIVLTTRADPPLSLARRRARQQLCELRIADLRFSEDEIGQLLNGQLGLSLSAESLTHLSERTEGWIAALQLTSLSLQNESDPQAFVAALATNNRFVADYLTEEVFAHQPPEIQSFLRMTAGLVAFSAELLTHLFPDLSTGLILRQLEVQNLFLIPLDVERSQFRYHHLFADLLKQTEHTGNSIEQHHILRRASVWHADRDEWTLAIDYAQKIDDYALLTSHILSLSKPIPNQEVLRLSWLNALPDEQYVLYPELHVIRSLLLTFVPAKAAAEQAQKDIALARERFGSRLDDEPFWYAHLIANETIINQALNQQRPNMGSAMGSACRVALARLGDSYPALRGRLYHMLGFEIFGEPDRGLPLAAFSQAQQLAGESGDSFIYLSAQVAIWAIREQFRDEGRGLVVEVAHFIRRSPLVQQGYPMSGAVYRFYGTLLLNQGEVDGAITALEKGLSLIILMDEFGQEFLIRWYLALAYQTVGRNREALVMLEMVAERAPVFADWVDCMRRWCVQWEDGKNGAISAEFNTFLKNSNDLLASRALHLARFLSYINLLDVIVIGRLAVSRQRPEDISDVINYLNHQLGLKDNTLRIQLQTQINLALMQSAVGQESAALDNLRKAVSRAQSTHVVLPFVEPRQPALALLEKLRSQDGGSDWLDTLTAASKQHIARVSGNSLARNAGTPALHESLTERELEIVGLIAEGLTNKEIAAQLFLSPNTVRVHTSNIYGKLGVPNRTQAAIKARGLGLIK